MQQPLVPSTKIGVPTIEALPRQDAVEQSSRRFKTSLHTSQPKLSARAVSRTQINVLAVTIKPCLPSAILWNKCIASSPKANTLSVKSATYSPRLPRRSFPLSALSIMKALLIPSIPRSLPGASPMLSTRQSRWRTTLHVKGNSCTEILPKPARSALCQSGPTTQQLTWRKTTLLNPRSSNHP